jgi:hypothetical protein
MKDANLEYIDLDQGYDESPKVYKITYKVYGINSANVEFIILHEKNAHVVGVDVADIKEELKKEHINSEFNYYIDNELYHAIGTKLVVLSVVLLGQLVGVTDKCLEIINNEVDPSDYDPDDDSANGTDGDGIESSDKSN